MATGAVERTRRLAVLSPHLRFRALQAGGQCQWRHGKPLRSMTAEDLDYHRAGAPFCAAAMGEEERVHRLAWGGYHDNLCLNVDRAKREKRIARRKRARRSVARARGKSE